MLGAEAFHPDPVPDDVANAIDMALTNPTVENCRRVGELASRYLRGDR